MAKIGYARVSTSDQDTSIQVEALKMAGCETVFQEQISGTTMQRPQLQAALAHLRAGETLVVTRIDRLARSLRDLQNMVHSLRARGIHLQATEQPIDTSHAAGKAFLDMLGVFSEFECNLRAERQAEGIAKAKAEGKYKGRAPLSAETAQKVRELIVLGLSKAAVARQVGVSRTTVYRVLTDKLGL